MINTSKETKHRNAGRNSNAGPGNPLPKAMIAGAATLAMLASGRAHAQSADALIDKLVAKGILTAKEAEDLRDESDKNFTTAFQTKMGMPDWVTGYKLSGDFRGRFEQYSSYNQAMVDRTRIRYRLRFGITMNMLDNFEAGFRLGSGDVAKGYNTATPLSNSSTFQDNFSKKDVFIDTAYGKWTAVNSGGWLVSATVGKMDIPFSFTPMVLDQDLTPEGAVIQSAWNINDNHTLSLNAGAFVLDEESGSVHDPFMYGGQFLWKAKWTDKLSTTLGVGGFAIVNQDQLTTANVPYINQGNTRIPFTPARPPGSPTMYVLQNKYTPVIADASATYTLDSFPLYNGAFPIKVGGEYMNNVSTSQNNTGYWVGVQFGKSGTKKTWDISYRYEYLQSDAWYDQLVDDDNVAFYPGDYPGANSSYGTYGGTNIKGHLVKFNYSFTDSVTFTVTCYINDLISLNGLQADPFVPDHKTSSMIHIMADINWLF
ncbi:MAG: putative porin [Verrucomicrobiae bacterium]|nr:putative porin [Verrucomicrobiae bacterium]